MKPHSLASLLAGLLALAVAFAATGLDVSDGWVREAPPSAQALAGYLRLENGTDRPIVVTGASSPQFAQVEFHETIVEDGVARMVARPRLEIPAGGALSLAPGGIHLMLMGPKKRLQDGDQVQLSLTLGSGEQLSVTLPVRRTLDEPPHHHAH